MFGWDSFYRWFSVRRQSRWLMCAVSFALLALVVLLNHVLGKDFSVTLLYLIPIAAGVASLGPLAGIVFCLLAAVSGMAIELGGGAPLAVVAWNASARFGVYIVFYVLFDLVIESKRTGHVSTTAKYCVTAGVALAAMLFVAAGVMERNSSLATPLHSASGYAEFDVLPSSQLSLAELTTLIQSALKTCRPLLLGSRDPSGPSCVEVSRTGAIQDVVPESKGDLDGGPGTSMAVLYYFDRQNVKSPMEDYSWHQTRLRTYLENNVVLNIAAERIAHEAAEQSRHFLEEAKTWSVLPPEIVATGFNRQDDWPGYCLTALDKAVSEKNLDAVKHWSNEVAAAAFWLEDLLRWRGFLYRNHLAALDFQAKCESLFKSAEQMHRDYIPVSTLSQFPAGVLGLNGRGNYYEVERQAERLYSMPADRFVEILENKNLSPASVWLPPASRATFLKLRNVLSPANQATWDLAARTPYEHGYLTNILFRARTAELVDKLAMALKKFDARNPNASVGELMNVMMYCGHSFAGIEWGDRYQPQLTQAAEQIPPNVSDIEALNDAWKWTYDFYKTPASYGITLTLRDALESKRLDCVRATDMIAAIFRNAGRARLGHVRWHSETGGHSVAAYMEANGAQIKPMLADGLTAPHQLESWPDCYFHGHEWPVGLESNNPPYSMELYLRGIDSYVWVQGYIVRGPNAGSLVTTSIPYSTHFQRESTEKVYKGPYPE